MKNLQKTSGLCYNDECCGFRLRGSNLPTSERVRVQNFRWLTYFRF